MINKSRILPLMVTAIAVLAISLSVTISGAYANGDEDPPPQSGKAEPDRRVRGREALNPSPREEVLPHRENRLLTVRPSSSVGELPGDKGDQDQAPTIPEKLDLKYPNLGSTLDRMVATVEDEGVSGQEAAADSPIQSRGSVAVTIHLNSNVEEVVSFLEDNGGDPRNVGEDYIEAYVPLTLLGHLSEQSGVTSVREIVTPQPAQIVQRIIGHGPPVHGSALWNQSGYSGQGIKVGIIDIGFKDLSGLIGTELPATIQGRCYTDIGVFTQDLADCEAVGEVAVDIPDCLDDAQRRAVLSADHGTIVAESVIDIAPEVSLYIANPQSRADLQDAADWMASEGVSVINHSVGWLFDGPGNGTSPSTISPLRTVDRAVASDIIWVNAAGNAARDTWFGGYSDPDGNGAIGFGGQNDQVIDMPVRECRSYVVQLRWEDDWGGASTDLDLYLYNKNTGEFVVSSGANQSGESGHVPFEALRFRAEFDSRDLGIVVDHYGGDAPDWIQLVFWTVDPIQHHTGSGSINNPAESANPGLLAVGAAPWNDVHTIEPNSSRGPTPDGRVKPDLVGVDCGATALMPLNEDYQGFCGTSQAAPHVAGMAALVRQQFPSYTPAQVAAYLEDNAEQRETSDPNNTWGHGFAQLPSSQVPETLKEGERAALVAFYNATGGPSWTKNANWANGGPVGRWHGVTTDPSGRVVGLSLPENGLTGEIPSELRSLANLTWLSLSENELGGDIPPELGNLSALTGLWLHENELSGVIPSQLADITNLVGLHLNENQLSGEIPPELGDLASLEDLILYGNQLSGEIPSELRSLANLTWLSLTRNQLSGDIPPELDSLTNLEVMALGGNQLSGEIPPELGDLASLEYLFLYGNQLRGEIPPELGDLASLEYLFLYGNQLRGEIPPELGHLASLRGLSLTRNQLSGDIPPELGSLTNLEIMALGGNQLSGSFPTWLGSLTNLQEFYLWGNQLSGEIPSELGHLASLTVLDLAENQLSGEIPSELRSLANLTWLSLTRNQLSGDIPPELDSLTNLEVMALGGNQLSGEIPPELGDLASLEYLFLYGNQLRGEIPPELGHLASLRGLSLTRNQLSGDIPPELGSLTNLEIMALGGNQLSGSFPTWLGSLTNLQEFYLWGNQLSGEIPSELGHLASLTVLDLAENQLSGAIPPELGDLASLEDLILYGNQLSGEIPSELRSLANLTWLSLTRNQLSGDIPPELDSLTNLEVMALGGNQLSGEIPPELGDLASLEYLFLYGNQLRGEIPPELGHLASLTVLDLAENQLSGAIPPDLSSLASLRTLSLWGNQLSGEIPPELGSLPDLERLYLNSNELTGTIPSELGNLAKLERLWLYDNQLTGTIPPGLGNLANLEQLLLSGNPLTGCIPAGFRNVTTNDFKQLGLLLCVAVLSAAEINGVTPGMDSLTVTWSAPSGGSAVTAYDLRYIRTSADGMVDTNWTVLQDVWTAGSVDLSYRVTDLINGTRYDVQVRAVSADGDGPWSAPVTATPSTRGGFRSFSPASVSPGGTVVVEVAVPAGYGNSGQLVETLPPRFAYVSGSLPDRRVEVAGRVITFMLEGEGSVTYTATAPRAGGSYVFSGVLRNSQGEEIPVDGAFNMMVEAARLGVSVTRSFSPVSVAPGGEVVVMINAANYGVAGAVTETLPEGFAYVSSSLADSQVSVTGQQVRLTLQGDTSFTYTVTASSLEGSYVFSGTLGDDEGTDHDVGGDTTVTVSSRDPLVTRYDANNNGEIEKTEVITAINEYLFGEGEPITKAEVIKLINLYLFGPA